MPMPTRDRWQRLLPCHAHLGYDVIHLHALEVAIGGGGVKYARVPGTMQDLFPDSYECIAIRPAQDRPGDWRHVGWCSTHNEFIHLVASDMAEGQSL